MADLAVPVPGIGPGIGSVPLADLDFTVVDVETTGWAPDDAAITEIGAVRVHAASHGLPSFGRPGPGQSSPGQSSPGQSSPGQSGLGQYHLGQYRVVAELGSLVNPGMPVPPAITELTGISDQMLVSAPPVAAVLPGLLDLVAGSVLTAHNAPFDLKFLTAACAGAGLAWPAFAVLDTVRLARHLLASPEDVPDRKLATLASFFGTPVQPSHRALDDARATAVVLGRLLERLAEREGPMTLDELDAWLAARDAEAAVRRAAARQEAAGPPSVPERWLAWLIRLLHRRG